MPKYMICFRVEHLLEGSIDVEASSPQEASTKFRNGDYDELRLEAKLDLLESEDSIAEIQEIGRPENVWVVPG